MLVLQIKNFKSIKELKIPTKKFNIFIGEPNSGKSNILEALGLLSAIGNYGNLVDFIRIGEFINIFFNDFYENSIEINYGKTNLSILIKKGERADFVINLENYKKYEFGHFHPWTDNKKFQFKEYPLKDDLEKLQIADWFGKIKYYSFFKVDIPYEFRGSSLAPPFGSNIFDVIQKSENHQNILKEFLNEFNLKLNLDRGTKKVKLAREYNGVIFSFDLKMVADTLVSYIYHLLAIVSNKNSTLIFEEPEGHIFPHYIKELAELISEDESNKFFITSHNPYFLETIISKCDPDQLQINLVYMENFETKVKVLNSNEITTLMKNDPFFAIDKLVDSQ